MPFCMAVILLLCFMLLDKLQELCNVYFMLNEILLQRVAYIKEWEKVNTHTCTHTDIALFTTTEDMLFS